MKCLFLVVLLLVCVVKCDDNNYYVIRAPKDEPRLKVYWNVPTMQCASKKILFDNLYQKYGIYQNKDDRFRGEKVTIMYDPGLFPALLKNETSGKFKFRNGGVPQEGDLDKHLEAFKKDLDLSIPDRRFDGIGIIDFESWRPIFRQNFGVLQPYKEVSYEIEKKLHWWWQKSWIEAEAKRRFESSARLFMQATIDLARELRPKGLWGFYGFPYCFNMASNNMVESCASNVPQENDRISWLWRSSTALYPSVYSSSSISTSQLTSLIKGRVKEARRLGGKAVPVLPYFWYRYRDAGFLTKTDLKAALQTFFESNASGFVIWGSSSDVNTVDKCKKLLDYVEKVLGPAVAKYTKTRRNDEIDDDDEIYVNNDELNVSDKSNKTEDIKKQMNEENRKKFTNYAPINEDNTLEEETAVLNKSVLVDLIINSLINNEIDSFNNNSTTQGPQIVIVTKSSLSEEETNNTVKYKNDSISNNKVTFKPTTESAATDRNIKNTQLDNISTTTEINFENYLYLDSSTKENDLLFDTTDATTEFDLKNTDSSTINPKFSKSTTKTENLHDNGVFFNLDTFNIDTADFNTINPKFSKSTTQTENLHDNGVFFNLDTFTIDTTDGIAELHNNINDKYHKKDLYNEVNRETVKPTVTEIHNTDKEEYLTENTELDVTTEPLHATAYIYNLETSAINAVKEVNIIKTESLDIIEENFNTTDTPQDIIITDTPDFHKTDQQRITSDTTEYDKTVRINFDKTIQSTTTDMTNFDQSTANTTSYDVQSSIEESTAISPTEDKVVVYIL